MTTPDSQSKNNEQLYTPAEVSMLESLTPEEVKKVKNLLASFSEFSNKQKKFNEEHDHTGLNSQKVIASQSSSSIIDDTKGNGDTDYVWSADKVFDQLSLKVNNTGNETITGIKTFGSFPLTPSSSPSTDYQVANKYYADLATYATASNTLVLSADTERDGINSSAAKQKEIRMNTFGTIRVKFSTESTVEGYNANGQIYINGVATGILRANSDTNVWHEYSEDFTVNENDLVQLYCWVGLGGHWYAKNFRVYYDMTKSALSTVITD